jgi:hypothetical protein
LLKGISLERRQADSLRRAAQPLRDREVALLTDAIERNSAALQAASRDTSAADKARIRALLLTPAVQSLRNQHMLVLRRFLTPAQVAVFDANLIAMRQREAQGG